MKNELEYWFETYELKPDTVYYRKRPSKSQSGVPIELRLSENSISAGNIDSSFAFLLGRNKQGNLSLFCGINATKWPSCWYAYNFNLNGQQRPNALLILRLGRHDRMELFYIINHLPTNPADILKTVNRFIKHKILKRSDGRKKKGALLLIHANLKA